MAHIPYERQAIIAKNASLNLLVPRNLEFNNFAVFCGALNQRLTAALHCISRYVGEVGIVVIHDDNNLNSRLSALPARVNRPNVQFRTDSGKVYDPLYGMSADAILNLLAPSDTAVPMAHSVDSLRLGIQSYLDIMKYKFDEHAGPFGNYPYNLDLLYQLCKMPITTLKDTVLRYLPVSVADPINSVLDTGDMQKKVLSCVNNLTSMMSDNLWENKGFANHTGISIIDSVTNKGIISIRVPHSHAGILNYIDAELKMLHVRNIPFLIVNCGVDISQNAAMQSWFLDEHEGSEYYTAIIAASLSSVADQKTSTSKLFSQYRQIFVFNCAGDVAEPFSAHFSSYYRLETEYTTGTTHGPLKLLPSHQHGKAERYVLERNIKVEDLSDLDQGVLLCGKAYRLPIIINNLT